MDSAQRNVQGDWHDYNGIFNIPLSSWTPAISSSTGVISEPPLTTQPDNTLIPAAQWMPSEYMRTEVILIYPISSMSLMGQTDNYNILGNESGIWDTSQSYSNIMTDRSFRKRTNGSFNLSNRIQTKAN